MRSPWKSALASGLVVSGLMIGLQFLGSVEPLELLIFDYLTRTQSEQQGIEPEILILEVTEEDIKEYNWPLPDHVLAKALAQLQQLNPQVIGLDLYRDLPYPPGTRILEAQLKADNTIAIQLIGNNLDEGEIPGPPKVPKERIGFNDLVLDKDGVIRRSLLFVKMEEEGKEFISFALLVVQKYLESQNLPFNAGDSLDIGSVGLSPLTPTTGGYQQLDHGGYQMLLRYQPPKNITRSISVTQLLNEGVDPDWVRGKIVLIGTTASSIKDLFFTPYSAGEEAGFPTPNSVVHHQQTELGFLMPGVLVHAQIVNQLLSTIQGRQSVYWFWPQWGETLWLVGWAIAGGLIVSRSRSSIALVGTMGVAVVSIAGIGWLAFTQMGWLPIAEPILALGLAASLTLAQRLFYNTSHDRLTGLFNQEAFLRQLRRFVAQNIRFEKANMTELQSQLAAVLFLDLDRFKMINESFGHRAGNRVLLEAVARLRKSLPYSALLARVGGDEFAIFLRNLTQPQILAIADALQADLAHPFMIDDHSALLSASIGIAFIQPNQGYRAGYLLRDAHTAMYRAKGAGRSRYEVFADGMRLQVVKQLEIETDLQQALDRGEFQLHYQPIICLHSGRIGGFEALIRWNHPEKGFISPGAFIPVAEETGLIIPLGLWVFREACRQLKQWERQVNRGSRLMMSINLSSRQFEQIGLVDSFQSVLQDLELDPYRSLIKLEITESMIMGDVDAAIDMMLQLKRLNFRLSIDDFGTGYSSLSYLRRFPVDTLKVDQSFVRRMESSQEDYDIVDTIITLGHKLNMNIVAEGIETSEQMQLIKTLGCEYAQGYFFSKPLASDVATELLVQKRKWL